MAIPQFNAVTSPFELTTGDGKVKVVTEVGPGLKVVFYDEKGNQKDKYSSKAMVQDATANDRAIGEIFYRNGAHELHREWQNVIRKFADQNHPKPKPNGGFSRL